MNLGAVMPPDANIPYEWQIGWEKDRLLIVVPSWSRTSKDSYIVFMDRDTRELSCECQHNQIYRDCHHVRGLIWFCAGPKRKRRGVQPNSRQAWDAIQDGLNERQKEVLEKLRELGEATDQELVRVVQRPINCITNRRGELVKMGLAEYSHDKISQFTGFKVSVFKAVC